MRTVAGRNKVANNNKLMMAEWFDMILMDFQAHYVSLEAEVLHHLVILMLQHVAVPYVPAARHPEPEIFSTVVAEFYA